MDVSPDGQGGTAVWFTEAAADKIGVLHVAADGTPLDQTDMSCGCGAPAGIAVDAAGDVWFTEALTNRIGRLTPGITTRLGPPASGCATTTSRAASRRSSRSSAASPS